MGILARQLQPAIGAPVQSDAETRPRVVEWQRRRKALIVGGAPGTMIRFRGPLIKELVSQGYEVVCATSHADAAAESKLQSLGARYVSIPLARGSLNPFQDLRTLWRLYQTLRQEQPDVVLTYNMKPTVYGTLAAWATGVKRRVAMVEGLGYAYTPGREWKRRLARAASNILYRIPCTLAHAMIVLNKDDREFFARGFMRRRERDLHMVPGIGVDLSEFKPEPLPDGPVTFVMISRLLRDKGVYEFVEAARRLKQQDLEARFVLVGGFDANPSAIAKRDVDAWVNAGDVEFVGEVDDVRPWLKQAHVFVLPSYREGLPTTVMEALAAGRPSIVSDVPGCRDVVNHNQTELVVRPRSVASLIEAMTLIVMRRGLVERWSKTARNVAAEKFDNRAAAKRVLSVMQGG